MFRKAQSKSGRSAVCEGPLPLGRNRESRDREAAGRRNWPEAVPRKMHGEKRIFTEISWNRRQKQTRSRAAGIIRTAGRPSDRLGTPAAQGETQQAAQWRPKRWLLPQIAKCLWA